MAEARVLLLLSGRPQSVGFAQSVCGLLGAGAGRGPWPTHCGLRRGQLLLSAEPFPGATARLPLQVGAPLGREGSGGRGAAAGVAGAGQAPRGWYLNPRGSLLPATRLLPFAALDRQPAPPGAELPAPRSVDLGVVVVLQSSDQTVLLTRRTRTLRVSPNLWVPPGGHVEPDEALLDAGLRELWEESGLQLPQGQFSWVPLGLWESAYPPRLSWGLPQYHHLVLYLLVVSQESQRQLQARIRPNPREVSASLWLGADAAAAVAASEDGTEAPRHLSQDLPPSVLALELEEGGEVRPLALPMSTLLRTTPASTEDTERVSAGTKFALGLWLQHLAG